MTSMSADAPSSPNVTRDTPASDTPASDTPASDTPDTVASSETAPDASGPSGGVPDALAPGGAAPGGMDHRRERIRVETERHRIVGELILARDGYRSRVSDVLNAPERDFITLTNATVQPLEDAGPIELHPFVTVARRHIVFAVAAGEES